MTLRHTRGALPTYDRIEHGDWTVYLSCTPSTAHRIDAALAELELAEAVIEAVRHAVSHYDATDTVPWIEDLIDALAALDASGKERDE